MGGASVSGLRFRVLGVGFGVWGLGCNPKPQTLNLKGVLHHACWAGHAEHPGYRRGGVALPRLARESWVGDQKKFIWDQKIIYF